MRSEILFFILVMAPFILKGQLYSVAGKALDNVTGFSIRDLTVVEKNTGIGTISSEDGSFSLLLRPGKIVLEFFSEEYDLFSASFHLSRDTIFQVSLSAIKSENEKRGKKEHRRSQGQGGYPEYPGRGIKRNEE